MERTAEFRRFVAGFGGSSAAEVAAAAPASVESDFMRGAGEMRGRLAELRSSFQFESVEPAQINACRANVGTLEPLASDLSDLGPRAPAVARRLDLVNFRRAVVRDLYEELRDLASRVQTDQMQEMRHENDVANFFTTGPSGAMVAASSKKKPPPLVPPAGTATEEVGAEVGGAADASLRAEEQELLAAFETNLDQIHQVKQKLGEVANMVSVFAIKAEEQQEIAGQILDDAEVATTNVEEAGKHLQKANDNKSSYNFYIVCWFMGSAIFLLIFDFIDARYSWI